MSRFDYVNYDETATALQAKAKEQCAQLEETINQLSKGRATSLALTKLEEVYMWIGKQIRDDQVARNGGAELQEGRNSS